MSGDGYVLAWSIYGLGCLGLLSVLWAMTRRWRSAAARQLVGLLVATLIFLPYPADPAQELLAPAWIIALLEGIFESTEALARAGWPLLTGLIGAAVLWVVLVLLWRTLIKRGLQRLAAQKAEAAKLEQTRASLLAESDAAG